MSLVNVLLLHTCAPQAGGCTISLEYQYMKEFDEYLQQAEPDKREKAEYWRTAIGLQKVDGLSTSEYLAETAKMHIEGEITIDEVKTRLDSYYRSREVHSQTDEDRTKEADIVAARITEILSERTITFSPAGVAAIHQRLFAGILPHAGQYRNYNISKREWVLNGASVVYVAAFEISMALDYDFQREKQFCYVGLKDHAIVQHIARFVAGIWQIHPFGEGNTRTTALFTIKYLRKLGFDIDNTAFEEHSWFFRNALVRASYSNIREGIDEWYEPLEAFFRNLLMHEQNSLKNRTLLIGAEKAFYAIINASGVTENDSSVTENGSSVTENGSSVTENGSSVTENGSSVTENGSSVTENGSSVTENGSLGIENGIIKAIRANPLITIAKLAETLSVSKRTIIRQLNSLKVKGVIRRVGPDKGGHWEVIEMRDEQCPEQS